jgi:hypothetical protein
MKETPGRSGLLSEATAVEDMEGVTEEVDMEAVDTGAEGTAVAIRVATAQVSATGLPGATALPGVMGLPGVMALPGVTSAVGASALSGSAASTAHAGGMVAATTPTVITLT